VVVVYDGTRFQVVSQLNSAGNATFANVSITSALNVGGVATFTANPVLSGGTANGVLYLNGSKVATSGTALTFDGTNLSGTGSIGTTIAGKTAQFDAAGGSIYASFADGTKTWRFGAGIISAGAISLYNATDAVTAFTVNATGNLGIGTSSITPVGSQTVLAVGNSSGGTVAHYQSGSLAYRTSASSSGVDCFNPNATPIQWYTSGTSRMLLDSSGNLGLGVTPSAWGGGFKAIQMTTGTSFGSHPTVPLAYVNANTFFDGSVNKYISSAFASRFISDGNAGGFGWQVAASGTAGNTISFTQAMTLDASGNLLVGTTSALLSAASRGNITVNGSSTSILTLGVAGAYAGYFFADASKAEIDAQGSRYLQFNTNGSERARITSGGNLLVGTTTVLNGSIFTIDAGSTWGLGIVSTLSGGVNYFAQFFNGASGVGSITANGTNTAYNTSSDYRLKDIDGPITNSGAYIDALKPVEGWWKADGTRFIGLLAHEVQEVSETTIATGEKDGEKMQVMDYSAPELIANLIAEIQSLRARVAQLESK
jgi:hypothetical protein